MGACKNCSFWGGEGDAALSQIPGGDGHRVCHHPRVGGGSYCDDSRQSLDSLNAYSCIGTGPDFGCIHFMEQLAMPLVPRRRHD